ncbi:hypothetical protein C823_005190 [Eubacterium plexicaudatum ASF492]|uniref:Uncharacterized protein n=1 Tax=Eubacterium plexicaudatum ASF492 TaxID=1235802 RepID=N2BE66_9FIRM|nr:hypothetical protein C823_005190 [Eubacterium plexicaudatum ASF492]
MDYDWKYFVDGLTADRAGMDTDHGDRLVARAVMYRIDKDQQKQAGERIRDMLAAYRQQRKNGNLLVEELVKAHAEYCKLLPDDEIAKRRHNSLVYRYMMKTSLHNKAVAVKMGVSKDTVQNDIRMAVNELFVLCFGLPAAGNSPGTYRDGVKELLHNYLLVNQMGSIRSVMPWENWQKEREKCQRVTARALRCLDNAVRLYEKFTAGSTYPDMQQRPLEIMREIYFKGSSIAAMAEEWHMSKETVYADIKKMTGRLAELIEVMAADSHNRERELRDGL